MSNMSYCRFGNTSKDLDDCFENWNETEEEELSESEKEGKDRILQLCRDIINEYG